MITDKELELLKLAVEMATKTIQSGEPDKVREHVKKNYETLKVLAGN